MDEKSEIQALSALIKVVIDERYDGIASSLADDLEEDRSNFSRITNGINAKGVRRVYRKLVRRGLVQPQEEFPEGLLYGVKGKTPTMEESSSHLVQESVTGYSEIGTKRVLTITINPEDDVTLPPEWAMPIILAAAGIILDRVDVDRARTAKEDGRKYRLRLLVEEVPPPESKEPPEAPAK